MFTVNLYTLTGEMDKDKLLLYKITLCIKYTVKFTNQFKKDLKIAKVKYVHL